VLVRSEMIREEEFARRVKFCRERIGLPQARCARLMKVSRQLFNNWEVGICKPKGRMMARLAVVLRCDIVWLQHGEGTELENRIDNVMKVMRIAVRDLEHIYGALRSARVEEEDAKVARVREEVNNLNHRIMETINE
jgi:transcriptional regulator with XRE-family HTH domain